MRLPTYRSWRFDLPGAQGARSRFGVSLTRSGVAMVEDEDSIKQAILMLLATSKGERLMRPEYGCELYKLVFSPNDETTAGLAIHYVRQAVTRFEPRIRITRLDAGKRISGQASDGAAGDLENNRLYIELEYQIRATSQVDRVELSLSLTGGDD